MNYRPSDIKLVPLKEVPAGSVAELVGRSIDIPLVLRLADAPGSEKARIMLLGGSYSFQVTGWSVTDALARVVCSADDLLFRLNDADDKAGHSEAGMLTLHNGGAYITAKEGQNQFHGAQIDLATWADRDRNARYDELVRYPNWQIGRVDHQGNFIALFQRNE